MASAIRHKTVRPDTTVLLQSVLTGNSEPVRVVSKTANDVALLFGNGCTLAYSAVSGDSVVYRADNGHEFKLFPAPAAEMAPAVIEAPEAARPTFSCPIPAWLKVTTPSGTAIDQVTIEDATETELLVRHRNGWIRVLRLISTEELLCQETDPRVPTDCTYKLTLRTAPSEKAA